MKDTNPAPNPRVCKCGHGEDRHWLFGEDRPCYVEGCLCKDFEDAPDSTNATNAPKPFVDINSALKAWHGKDSWAQVLLALYGTANPDTEKRFMGQAMMTIERLRDLVGHCWVHSGYRNCGYDQMTTEQRALYDSIVQSESEDE